MEDIVQTERIDHVLRIVLNRPKVNAIGRALGDAIHAAAKTRSCACWRRPLWLWFLGRTGTPYDLACLLRRRTLEFADA
jgi:hypothetical protein